VDCSWDPLDLMGEMYDVEPALYVCEILCQSSYKKVYWDVQTAGFQG
jgi:hypothetical protein